MAFTVYLQKKEIFENQIPFPPGSFHRVFPDIMHSVFISHYLEIENGLFGDLSRFSYLQLRVPVGSYHTPFEWRFGFWFSIPFGKVAYLESSSHWKGKLVDNKLTEIEQNYGKDVKVKCICDNNISTDEIYFSHFEDSSCFIPVLKMNCSQIKFYQYPL